MERSRSSFSIRLSGILWKTCCGQSWLVLLLSSIVHCIGITAVFWLLTRDSVNLAAQPQHVVVQSDMENLLHARLSPVVDGRSQTLNSSSMLLGVCYIYRLA